MIENAEEIGDQPLSDYEVDPVAEWLMAELKEITTGKPTKTEIMSGLKGLLAKAGGRDENQLNQWSQ